MILEELNFPRNFLPHLIIIYPSSDLSDGTIYLESLTPFQNVKTVYLFKISAQLSNFKIFLYNTFTFLEYQNKK